MQDKLENLTPILVDARTAAKLIGVGLSMLYALDSAGRLPQKIKLNSKSLYNFEQLKLWASLGCPSRDSVIWQDALKEMK